MVTWLARQWAAQASTTSCSSQDGPVSFLKTDLENAYGAVYRSVLLSDFKQVAPGAARLLAAQWATPGTW
eukprot:10855922-Lingulodinium_polyedra.AAC.1